MTPEEAIMLLNNEYRLIECRMMRWKGTEKENTESFKYRMDVLESLKMAIAALMEVQRYRKIGTVEECRKAGEKQKEIADENTRILRELWMRNH